VDLSPESLTLTDLVRGEMYLLVLYPVYKVHGNSGKVIIELTDSSGNQLEPTRRSELDSGTPVVFVQPWFDGDHAVVLTSDGFSRVWVKHLIRRLQ